MMEFALSKLNLLIFVTAIAAIVLFFMNTVNSNFRTRQSYELTYKVGESIKSGIESNSYCNIKSIEIPTKIKINSGSSYNHTNKYILNISSFTSGDQNKLIVSVLDSKKKNIFAAYDIDYNGTVNLYSWNYNNGIYKFENTDDSQLEFKYLDFDTLRMNSIDNRIIVAKKIINNRAQIYIFACGYKNNIPGCASTNSNFLETLIKDEEISCFCRVPELKETLNICNLTK
jgi:hypothetical protein